MRKNFLLLVTSIILIISFGFSTIVSLKSLDKLIKENNKENSLIYANEVGNAVIDVFSEAIAVSQTINNPFIRGILKNPQNLSREEKSKIIRNFLSDIVVKFGYSTAFIADDSTLDYYSEWGYLKTIDPQNPDDDWYVPFKTSEKLYELNVDNDQANDNRMTIYINTRMRDKDGKYIGACGVGVPMKQVMTLLQSLEKQSDISIKLVSPDGVVRVARSGQLVLERTEAEIKELLKEYDTSKQYLYKTKGPDGYTIVKYIPECQWFAVIDYNGGRTSIFSTMLFQNLMICLFVMLFVIVIVNFVLSKLAKHTEKFVEEALFDQLTGLRNRRAYALEIEKLNKFPSLANISVTTMDINGLKMTNDTFGHTAGDDLLKGAAAIMKKFYSDNSWKVFRTGGDEFVALTSKPIGDKDNLIADFKNQLKTFHHAQIKELSVSIGIAKGTEHDVSSVEELIKIADKKMYADKELFYSDDTHERRKR
jgi:diguanylate cyclase (GGDEF)-like protein